MAWEGLPVARTFSELPWILLFPLCTRAPIRRLAERERESKATRDSADTGRMVTAKTPRGAQEPPPSALRRGGESTHPLKQASSGTAGKAAGFKTATERHR